MTISFHRLLEILRICFLELHPFPFWGSFIFRSLSPISFSFDVFGSSLRGGVTSIVSTTKLKPPKIFRIGDVKLPVMIRFVRHMIVNQRTPAHSRDRWSILLTFEGWLIVVYGKEKSPTSEASTKILGKISWIAASPLLRRSARKIFNESYATKWIRKTH